MKILTIDDSRAVRMIVSKHARQLGFDVDEAEDGAQGLQKLEQGKFDLVVLDITMPVVDGPGMLTRLRERGDNTPVLMLTSESKRSIVAGLIRTGISDYILKPFKPEELTAKMLKALKLDKPPSAKEEEAVIVSAPGEGAQTAADILVVDDMENVHKRLRTMVPQHITMASALNGPAALAICRERAFRAVLMDNDIPEVSSASLLKQLRVLQPSAAFLMMALRSSNDLMSEAREQGFDGVVLKPFTQEAIEDFLLRHFDNQEVVATEENVLKVAAFKGREARIPGYFLQVSNAAAKGVEHVAAACFSDVILDLSQLPPIPEKAARLVMDLSERAKRIGVELRLVGGGEVAKALKQYSETAGLPLHGTVAEAQAAGGA